MNIILVGKYRGKPIRCQIDAGWQILVSFVAVVVGLFLIAGAGYLVGVGDGKLTQLTDLEDELSYQKTLIKQTRTTTESELDALAARLGLMQAHVTRLNALGQRLIKISRIDPSEFDFNHQPAYGGPHDPNSGMDVGFENVLGELSEQLDSREQQLSILEDVLVNKLLLKESRPVGRPIGKGWISSYYGKRTDPFTGKIEMHKGMDFAAKMGSKIMSVANGIVTWSGPRYGYGTLVEINHGNGYTTRYGHNAETLVEVGDMVEKGQTISLMGSSGRSTGPHVHFEVLKNNRQIDPLRFVQAKG